MSVIGIWDTKELEKWLDDIKQLTEEEIEKFHIQTIKEMAARTLAKIIAITPVGEYPPETGKVGGTLRRGWTAGKDTDAFTFIMDNTDVIKKGNTYTIVISNNVFYAPFVEYGHRQNVGQFVPAIGKRLVKPYVEGQFMMTKSIDEMKEKLPTLLEKKLNDFLKEHFQ